MATISCCHGWSIDGVGAEKYLPSNKNLSLAELAENETSQAYSEYQSLTIYFIFSLN